MNRINEADSPPNSLPSGRSWNRFFKQFQLDVKFWLFCLILLELFRLAFIFYFRQQINESSTYVDILAVVLNGLRYDLMVAAYWALPPLLVSITCGFADLVKVANRLRMAVGVAFTIVSAILFRVALGFFEEFNDVFNHWIFELYYDNPRTIFTTVASQYNLLGAAIFMAVVVVTGVSALMSFLRYEFVSEDNSAQHLSTVPRKAGVSLVIALLFVGALRGGYGSRPAQRKDAAVTRDGFLNKAVLNPYAALRYALKEHLRLMGSQGLAVYLPDEDIVGAARYAFSKDEPLNDLDAYMLKHAQGHKNQPARHIFLIIMESYDTWPLLGKYSSLKLTERLKKLAKNGLYIENFLPASDGTMSSLAAIVTGLPDAGVYTDYRQSAKTPYPSSIADTFRRLGYKTRLFYGGYLSWHRIGDFFSAQGFEEVYGGADIGEWISTNEWGVQDEHLFSFVSDKVSDRQPSFNLILSTTYHPPYDIDVFSRGYSVREVPEQISRLADKPVDLNVLGHLWYADKCLGDFVGRMEGRLNLAVFAITGDHSGRKHIQSNPGFFERSAVPLVLYGRDVLQGIHLPKNAAGSHIDICPTLIELAAPPNFPYHSVGSSLLASRERPVGIAQGKLITSDFILDLSGVSAVYPLPGKRLPNNPPDLKGLKRLHDAVHAIAWWRIMRGSGIAAQR